MPTTVGILWPGYGENSRVLKWVFERVAGRDHAVETPIGLLPTMDGLDTEGLDLSEDDLRTLLEVDTTGWSHAIPQIREHYAQFDGKMPAQLSMALDALEEHLR